MALYRITSLYNKTLDILSIDGYEADLYRQGRKVIKRFDTKVAKDYDGIGKLENKGRKLLILSSRYLEHYVTIFDFYYGDIEDVKDLFVAYSMSYTEGKDVISYIEYSLSFKIDLLLNILKAIREAHQNKMITNDSSLKNFRYNEKENIVIGHDLDNYGVSGLFPDTAPTRMKWYYANTKDACIETDMIGFLLDILYFLKNDGWIVNNNASPENVKNEIIKLDISNDIKEELLGILKGKSADLENLLPLLKSDEQKYIRTRRR